jgi:flagellar biosynthesis protein FlgN
MTPIDFARLGRLLELEEEQMAQFVALLEQEKDLLIAGEVDALVALADEKTKSYRLLQRVHDQRAILLGNWKGDNSGESIAALLTSMPELSARWERILELARLAHEQNQLNGQLINERLANNQAALSVLMTAAERPQFYGADGRAKASGTGRILGRA